MPIGVRVEEYSGAEVGHLEAVVDVNLLCTAAAAEPDRFPLLSGVDEHGDTWFNARQCARLATELTQLEADPDSTAVRQAAREVGRLAALLVPAPGRPHHRRLLFSGD
jgi:hypothetical protein